MPWINRGTATFSCAVSVGSRLNCWKIKPISLRRKVVFSFWLSRSMRMPKTSTSPLVASRIPASTLSSVVLPQPEGPTSSNSSPQCTEKSTSTSARTSVLASPKSLLTPRRQAATLPFELSQGLATEHHRRFKFHHLANADQSREQTDCNHDEEAYDEQLPGSRERHFTVLPACGETEDSR